MIYAALATVIYFAVVNIMMFNSRKNIANK